MWTLFVYLLLLTMPRGGKRSHKGRGKQFSNPEEIDRQMKAQKELEENPGAAEKGSDADSDEESSSDEENDKKEWGGGLIEIENPNRVSQKSKKVAELDVNAPRELSRREREEIEKQKVKTPKPSASRPPESFNTHFSLRGSEERGGDLEEESEGGGNQNERHRIRGAP
ncbi:hypothetical protein F7725_013982 [Dissostichus mawsoni]|uniref:Casein kinase substrate phosphoprotein PP28 domain-containing protein n=1 Tax=Dissostichus mawsoni TaxID=36200 RepID=A0A7J5YUM8_DISMA|nr:hypothetical protein F7725_013982 [Dissostichus mawsoni]